jgi:hypothetical protein
VPENVRGVTLFGIPVNSYMVLGVLVVLNQFVQIRIVPNASRYDLGLIGAQD